MQPEVSLTPLQQHVTGSYSNGLIQLTTSHNISSSSPSPPPIPPLPSSSSSSSSSSSLGYPFMDLMSSVKSVMSGRMAVWDSSLTHMRLRYMSHSVYLYIILIVLDLEELYLLGYNAV
jgi:hypothetical protein